MTKICPILTAGRLINYNHLLPSGNVIACQGDECAWWDYEMKRCRR